jgi:hypothetical protein
MLRRAASIFQPTSGRSSPSVVSQGLQQLVANPSSAVSGTTMPAVVGLLHHRHVLQASNLDRHMVHALFNYAHELRFADPASFCDTLKGRVLATIFYEPSTRTHYSFQAAMEKLGW